MGEKKTFQAVKGTRDFYPDVMRVRNWIMDTWRKVSLRNGFEEYDAPIFEYLDLFTVKSGEEIAEQLFSLTDRGGRNLAIRPEITPSLARMAAAKINSLPRPIKWFSMPRLCRAERPQRGRLREFFQWNVDILGVECIQADAECIYCLVDFLREVGLTPADIKVRVGSRPLTVAALKAGGLETDAQINAALAVLDKRAKVDDAGFVKLTEAAGLTPEHLELAEKLQEAKQFIELKQMLEDAGQCGDDITSNCDDLGALIDAVGNMGIGEYVQLDMGIVRGLAYYTGIVYEAVAEGERAVAGGGRYDRLLELVGGPECSATGFGMGDVVLGLLLADKGKIPQNVLDGGLDVFVIDAAENSFSAALELVTLLRQNGACADYSFKRAGVGKQMKEANRRNARLVAMINDADLSSPNSISLKDMAAGEQCEVSLEEAIGKIRET